MLILKIIKQHKAYLFAYLKSYKGKHIQCQLHKLLILGVVGLGGQTKRYMHKEIITKHLKMV
jgi:hypothetical protein